MQLFAIKPLMLTETSISCFAFDQPAFLTQLFNTNNINIIHTCRQYSGVKPPGILWCDRVSGLENKFVECAKFQLRLDSLHLSLHLLFCLSFYIYLLPYMVN